jgi:hypothetical protein
MIQFLPLFVFLICLAITWFITTRYEYKFEYPFKESLVDLMIKSQAFYIPEEPIKAEHREAPLYYKVEFSKIFENGLHMELAKLMAYFIKASGVTFDRLIGVGRRLEWRESTIEKYWIVPLLSGILKKPYAMVIEIASAKELTCEGEIKDGETVILIDDVLTTGKSIINAAKYLREKYKNIKVAHAFTFLTRFPQKNGGLKGAKSVLLDYGIELHTIIDNVGLINMLYKRRHLTLEQLQRVLKDEDLQGSLLMTFKNPSLK